MNVMKRHGYLQKKLKDAMLMRVYLSGLILFLVVGSSLAGFSQTTGSGDIRGTVTDSTGALIPAATVTVVNIDTGVSINVTTNAAGVYDTSSIVLGNYMVTFSKQGFQKLVRGPVTVRAGYTTVSAQLKVGSETANVVVDAHNVPLLSTETAEQSITLEAQAMEQMPEVGVGSGPTWENFVILTPGATGAASASGAYSNSSNPQETGAAVNGNLPYYNVTLDGSTVLLVNSGNNVVIPLEDIKEVQIQASTFSAEQGIGGVQYNQISKGGTNKFHGAVYEYLQNDALNAANYGFGAPVKVPFLRFDNFGGAIGGPILKNKLFFYFNYDRTYNNSGANTGFATLPTKEVMNGDFTGFPTIYDPTTQVVKQTGTCLEDDGTTQPAPCVIRHSFASEYGNGNKIPQSLINPVALKIQSLFPTATNHPSSGFFIPGVLEPNGTTANNYYYSLATASWTTKYFGRLDYDVTAQHRITISDSEQDAPALGPSIFAAPVGWQNQDGENNNAQISDVWTISPRLINEARFGFTDELDFFADKTIGKGYPEQLGLSYAKADALPAFNITGGYASIAPASNAILKQFTFAPSDVVTLVTGKHILHFGGEFLIYQDNATAWGNTNSGTFTFSGNYTSAYVGSGSTGAGYADFLLGDSNYWSAYVVPEYGGRYKTPQMFAQDDIKLKPNLTLNLGVRYVIQHGWNEVKGNEASFDPTILNPATGTLGAMWYGTTHANGRTSLEANIWSSVLPRVGFAWEPLPNTTVRGGWGLYNYNYTLNSRGLAMGGALQSTGSASDLTNGITPVVNLSGTSTVNGNGAVSATYTASQLPYGPIPNTPDALNGQGPWYQEYHAPDTKIEQWTLDVQRMLTPNIVAEIAYVASHGYNLPFQSDINQVPESKLGPQDNPSGRPYPQFQNMISWGGNYNAVSNYNAFQASITQRSTSGLSFSFNYVWSHFLNDQDSAAWQAPSIIWQNAFKPSANYGPSSFDVRNAFKGYVTYEMPFGIGRRYLGGSGLNARILDSVVGGWNVSAIVRAQSGNPFTPIVSNNQSFAQDGFWYPNVIGNPKLSHPSIHTGWFNPTAFAAPQAGTFGNAHRNSVYGPGLTDVDMSLGKTFALAEGIKWEIRGDATNVFNHPSFGDPNYSLYCPTLGAACPSTNVTYDRNLTNGGRKMQISTRLSF
ncbi:MAG TPA: TonB-dependent receptor [Alloacidobacterium sp.]|nr:TonB-dependent receptor [Alloacidobacterium sp.]